MIISNEELKDIMKIVISLEEFVLLKEEVKETIKNEVTEQKYEFLIMLIGILGICLIQNLLAGKGVTRAGEGTIRAGQDF